METSAVWVQDENTSCLHQLKPEGGLQASLGRGWSHLQAHAFPPQVLLPSPSSVLTLRQVPALQTSTCPAEQTTGNSPLQKSSQIVSSHSWVQHLPTRTSDFVKEWNSLESVFSLGPVPQSGDAGRGNLAWTPYTEWGGRDLQGKPTKRKVEC